MGLQMIQDEKGKATGVFIPIKEWKALKKQYKTLEELEFEESSKNQIISEIKEAIHELKLIEQGKATSRPASELLNEL